MNNRSTPSFKLLPYVSLLIVFLWLGIITVVHLGISRSGRQISRLQNKVAMNEARNQYLQLKIANLSNPETVTTYAQEKLGFVQLKPHQIILLDTRK